MKREIVLELTQDQLRQRRGKKWADYGPDILPAWVADMDFASAPQISEALEQLINQQEFIYASTSGRTTVEEAFAGWMTEQFQWNIAPKRVELVSDALQGLAAILEAFSNRGDGVLLSSPIYPPLMEAVHSAQRMLVDIPMVQDDSGFFFDFTAIEERLIAGDIRILILCNPQNPTGRVFREDELRKLLSLAERYDLLVVADEIHADLLYPEARHTVFSALSPEAESRTITLNSATKSFNLGGMRCAVMYFGSDALHEKYVRAFPSRLLGRVSVAATEVTIAAWEKGQKWLEQVLTKLQKNREIVRRWAKQFPDTITIYRPEGTYFAWIYCELLAHQPYTAQQFFLEEAKVALSAGEDFGANCSGWVRLNFATSETILNEILERMSQALQLHAESAVHLEAKKG